MSFSTPVEMYGVTHNVRATAEWVQVHDGVVSIDGFDGRFSNFLLLHTVVLPQSLRTIGDHAFYRCPALTWINFSLGPLALTTIGVSAFAFCSALESINIPQSVTTIGHSLGTVQTSNNECLCATLVKCT